MSDDHITELESCGYLVFDEDQADELLDLIVQVRKHLRAVTHMFGGRQFTLANDFEAFIDTHLLHAMPITRDDT